MTLFNLKLMLVVTALTITSCGESRFATTGGIGSRAEAPVPQQDANATKGGPEGVAPWDVNLDSNQHQGSVVSWADANLSIPVCTTSPQGYELDASVPIHRSTTREASAPITAHVLESSVITIPTASIRGSVLQVKEFGIDDVAIIVPPSTTESAFFSVTGNRQREVRVPAEGMIIYDGSNSNFADGRIDDRYTTTYVFQDNRIVIGTKSQTLADLYNNLNLPMVAHNAVDLSTLAEKGYWDSVRKELSFKIMHVAHGRGFLNFLFCNLSISAGKHLTLR